MKRWNLLAASTIAATFVLLAVLPLTKNALRFDMQLAAGRPILGNALVDMGIRQADMPLGGIGPILSVARETQIPHSPELPVRIAEAMQLSGRMKWDAFQRLVADFPENPAGHAALVRIACKNGGSVGVGHDAEQEELSATPSRPLSRGSDADPNDALVMLRSCEAGERLAPDNAYFPAMAAIAHYALNHDSEAQAALHRATTKPRWYEYIDVEAAGRVRRAEQRFGPQNSLTQTASYAAILFPHYAALRSMARVATVQAMHAEQEGNTKTGLALRHDVATLGEKMREQSSSLIGGLVGMAMVNVAEGRTGGAPALHITEDLGRKERDTQFLSYITVHGGQAEAAHWQALLAARDDTRAIIKHTEVSAFGTETLIGTQLRLLVNLALLGAATLLCVLGGLALLRPWLGRVAGNAASGIVVVVFMTVIAWQIWQGLGNLRDALAYTGLMQGLASDDGTGGNTPLLSQSLITEAVLGAVALLTPLLYLVVVALRSALVKKNHAMSLYQRSALPVAAVLTLAYAAHLAAFALRERTVQAELQQVLQHEGRHIAAKLGKTWPGVPE